MDPSSTLHNILFSSELRANWYSLLSRPNASQSLLAITMSNELLDDVRGNMIIGERMFVVESRDVTVIVHVRSQIIIISTQKSRFLSHLT